MPCELRLTVPGRWLAGRVFAVRTLSVSSLWRLCLSRLMRCAEKKNKSATLGKDVAPVVAVAGVGGGEPFAFGCVGTMPCLILCCLVRACAVSASVC